MGSDAVEPLARDKFDRLSYFAPTEQEILAANRAIFRSLLEPRADEPVDVGSDDRSWIIGHLDGYCVQYWGEVHPKPRERVVIANFFLCSMHDVGDYSAEIVAAMGGGAAYWRGAYDTAAGRLLWMYVNAPK